MAKIVSVKDKKIDKKIVQAPVYDSTKAYEWKPEDDFVLTGNEFGLLYQIIKAEVSLPGGVSIRDKIGVFELLEGILRDAVAQGVAKEAIIKEEAPN